jgi:predicted RNA methylase
VQPVVQDATTTRRRTHPKASAQSVSKMAAKIVLRTLVKCIVQDVTHTNKPVSSKTVNPPPYVMTVDAKRIVQFVL